MKHSEIATRLFSLCLSTLLLITNVAMIFPAPAWADVASLNVDISTPNNYICLAETQKTREIMPIKNGEINGGNIWQWQEQDNQALKAILASTILASSLGSIKILTISSTAHSLMALLGAGTVTTVAVPVAGIVAAGGVLVYGGYKTYTYLQNQTNHNQANNQCFKMIVDSEKK